jgi:hypothetical protein
MVLVGGLTVRMAFMAVDMMGLATAEDSARAEHASRPKDTMRPKGTVGSEEGAGRWGWWRLGPRRTGAAVSKRIHHSANQPGVRRNAVFCRLLIYPRLD